MIFVRHSKSLAKSRRFIAWRTEVRATTRASFTLSTLKHRKRLMHSRKWTENASAYQVVHVRWKCWSLQGNFRCSSAKEGPRFKTYYWLFLAETRDQDGRTMNRRNMCDCLSLCRRDCRKMNCARNSPNTEKLMASHWFAIKWRANARDSLTSNISSEFMALLSTNLSAFVSLNSLDFHMQHWLSKAVVQNSVPYSPSRKPIRVRRIIRRQIVAAVSMTITYRIHLALAMEAVDWATPVAVHVHWPTNTMHSLVQP